MKKISLIISIISFISTIAFFYISKDIAATAMLSASILFFIFAFGEELPIKYLKIGKELEITLKDAKTSLQQIQDLAYNSAETVLLLQKAPTISKSVENIDFAIAENILPAKTKKLIEPKDIEMQLEKGATSNFKEIEKTNQKIFKNLEKLNIPKEKIEKLKQEYGE